MEKANASIAQYYHNRTKYDPETISSKSRGLDWENQPVPFKEYKLGSEIDLKPYLKAESQELVEEADKTWYRLSQLLLLSYGVTARLETTMGPPLYLRAAPSAGGLYPAEIYLIARDTSLLPAGLYNYQCRSHSLINFWQSEIWQGLQKACLGNPVLEKTELAIVLTAVFYRSAWRYEDRAYRRIFLDSGHLLGNIELASSLSNYQAHLIGGFADNQLNNLLYLEPEIEEVIAVVPLVDQLKQQESLSPTTTVLASSTQTDYPTVPDGQLLSYLHEATKIEDDRNLQQERELFKTDSREETLEDKYNFPFCTKVSTATNPINWGGITNQEFSLQRLENTILKRRSTRSYNGENITLEELKAILDFTYQASHYLDQGLNGAPDYFQLNLIETFVAVSGVNDLEEGCYYYAPIAQELRQIRFKNFRRELHYLCLGQELGRDASTVVFHTADLKKAVDKLGDRAYRYLHMDAGHLGQRLNLAAIGLGLGVSGIGGFFDDLVNEVLGIPTDEAVLYVTTLGRPKRR